MKKYRYELEKIENGKSYWNYLKVNIFNENRLIGSYNRNYPNMMQTFLPFEQDSHDYALISEKYYKTSVLDLESGEIIATESDDAIYEPYVNKNTGETKKYNVGFCPNEFWHPNSDSLDDPWDLEDYNGEWALVSGCVWGDDCSMKVEFLDLTKITEGLVVRDNRFGYIELGSRMKNSVDWYPDGKNNPGKLVLPIQATVSLAGGKPMIYSDVSLWKDKSNE